MAKFLALWDTVSGISLQQGISDKHMWRWSSSGQYTVKFAYHTLRIGSIRFRPWKNIWKLGHWENVVSSYGWLPTTVIG
jgi:hypothetical protein